MKLLLSLFLTLYAFPSLGGFAQTLTTSMGMVNVNITENASSLSSTDSEAEASEAASTTASVISMDINYEFLNYATKSYFIRMTAPLLSSDGSGFFSGGVGVNFYQNSLSSMFSFNDSGTTLTMSPTFRWYWGPTAGIGFVVYNTETAKKSDILFDLEVHAGSILNFKRDWGLRGEGGISRGTGISSSTMSIKIFIGLSYYLED